MTTTNETAIETIISQRRDRDSKLAASGRKRSDKYLAYFASAAFATARSDFGITDQDLLTRCDKTLDRLVRVLDCLHRDTLQLKNESDQNRYTFNLVRNLVKSVSHKKPMSKSDILATATKREDAAEYVDVSSRIMADSTADRQSGIAIYVLETLGVIERVKTENNTTIPVVNKNSKAYKKFCKLIAANA